MARKYISKTCEFCGSEFKVGDNVHERSKRFCNTSCSAQWRNITYGAHKMSMENKQKMARLLHERWQDPEFRHRKISYMHANNPMYDKTIVNKANDTRFKNGSFRNNYKYGNGKISKYEQLVMEFLKTKDFYYNYAIPTKLARHAFPEEHFAMNYKPDFVNLKYKICIEIDGETHNSAEAFETDSKKDRCLTYLGFKVYRFTHEQIANNYFFEEVERIWQSL